MEDRITTAELSDIIAEMYENSLMDRAVSLCSTGYDGWRSTDWSGDVYVPEEKFVRCDYCGYENAWERGSCDMCGAPLVHIMALKEVTNGGYINVLEPTNQFDEPVIKPSLWQDIIGFIFGRKE